MLHDLLKQHWGYDSFLPLQEEAIRCALERRDSLVVLPTGGGKSLCYQLPALCMDGLAIVVSPLISLMKDQVDALGEIGIPAAALNSASSAEQQRRTVRDIAEGRLKIVYLAPERLLAPATLDLLASTKISLIAVDEAHCISSWGHDFRPEYRGLSQIRGRFPGVSLHGFTATATEQVRADIAAQLHLKDPKILVGSFHRPNLFYHVERRATGWNQVCNVMERFRNQAGIVYAITRDRVEQISQTLNQLGYRTLPYHAGLPEAVRTRHQEALINDEIEAIVATVAFGMGIDKSNVRFVIHAEVPKSLESYQQESGRAGRDALEAECWLLYSGQDFMTWQRIIDNSPNESRAAALESLQKMRDYCVSTTCRHGQLVGHFGQRLANDCQACDVCLGKLTLSPDSLVLGQKILSCVVRCRQRFGAEHITKVLAGSNEARVVKFGHNQLSTWGLLKEVPRRQIRDWIDQLVAQGFLESVGEYPVLTVTPTGRQVLRGETSPELSQPAVRDKAVTPARLVDSWEGVDRGLFDELRRLRAQLAGKAKVAAFIIFSDATLRDLARRRPTSREALLGVHGIGQHKSEAYGAAVIELIDRHCREHDIVANVAVEMPVRRADAAHAAPSRTASASFELFDQGLSIAEIGERLGRAPSTVLDYLLQYIHARKITDASRWASPYEIQQIETAAQFNDTERLKPIHEALHGRVSYETIRMVLQCARNRDG